MDLRLIAILSISLFLLCCGRKVIEEISEEQNVNVREFKLVFFLNLVWLMDIIMKFGFKKVLSTDRSLMGDFPLGMSNYKLIDSLANNQLKLIRNDSMLWMNKHPNELHAYVPNRKRVLKHCLDYYNSFELDSIARNATKDVK